MFGPGSDKCFLALCTANCLQWAPSMALETVRTDREDIQEKAAEVHVATKDDS